MRGTVIGVVAGAATAALFGDSAWAFRDDADAGTADTIIETQAGIAIYAPAFFATYSPVTALDMVVLSLDETIQQVGELALFLRNKYHDERRSEETACQQSTMDTFLMKSR